MLTLLEELQRMLAEFEVVSEEARAKRLSHIGARADLQGIAGKLIEEVRVLDGINRWQFGKDPEVMAEWEAARHLPPSRPAAQPVKLKEVTPPDAGRVAPAA